jgi:hypothetical protein
MNTDPCILHLGLCQLKVLPAHAECLVRGPFSFDVVAVERFVAPEQNDHTLAAAQVNAFEAFAHVVVVDLCEINLTARPTSLHGIPKCQMTVALIMKLPSLRRLFS